MNVSYPVVHSGWSQMVYTDSRFPGQQFTSGSGQSVVTLGTETRTLNSNKDWRTQVSKKLDATTDYQSSRFRYRPMRWMAGSWCHFLDGSVRVDVNARSVHSSVPGVSLINSVDDTALRDLALARLKNRLNGDLNQVKLLVPLAELREMRGMIHASANMATDLVKSLLEIKRTKGKSAVKYAADAWLNFSFGVRPFVSDVQNACESISSYLLRQRFTRVVHGSATKTWLAKEKASATPLFGFNTYNLFEGVHSLSYRYVAGIDFSFLTSNNYGISDQFGFEFASLPASAWELVPYSWLVDYFTTVGAYLDDTFVVPPGSTIYCVLNKRYTLKGESRVSISSITPDPGQNALISYFGPSYGNATRPMLDYSTFSRTKLSSLPRRQLRFKTADEIGKNAVNRLLNLTSLLAPSARGLPRRNVRPVRGDPYGSF